jgi:hypothetical protein
MFHRRLEYSDPVLVKEYLKSRPKKAKTINGLSQEVRNLLLIQNGLDGDNEEEENQNNVDGNDRSESENFLSYLCDEMQSALWEEGFEEDEFD